MQSIPLIHIGYHKTGTSWLQERLFPRRDLGWMRVSLKQPRFHAPHSFDFDAESYRAHYLPRVAQATEEGAVPVLSGERLSGNPHSGGYDSKEIADRLRSVFDDARILVVVREQRSMILSSYFQYVRVGGACSLADYAFAPPDYRRPMFSLDNFRYDRLVAYYQKLFGRSRVMVGLFEDFRANVRAFVRSVSRFGGAETPDDAPFDERVNPSLGPVSVCLRRRMNPFLKRDSVNGYSPLHNRPIGKLLRPTIRLADHLAPEPLQARLRRRWKDEIDERVGTYFAESNRRLSQLIDVDLAAHGYVCEE
ncbi:MAG: sulfotransferase [Planctomycetes bacterium]|nr:sulfotransferase [Planctomycetota bacterium]